MRDVARALRTPYAILAALVLIVGVATSSTFNPVPSLILFALVLAVQSASIRQTNTITAKLDQLLVSFRERP